MQIATIPGYCKFFGLDRMDFVLYLYIEIDSQDCLQGARFIYIITELSDELQHWLSICKEYI